VAPSDAKIPVIKEQARAAHPPGYIPPTDAQIPVIKEQPKAAHAAGYIPPDHTKPVPQIKVVINLDGKEETRVVPAGTTEQPLAPAHGLPKYVPPTDAQIPVIKEDPTKFKGYVQW